MDPEKVAELCGDLTLLKFFPADLSARTALLLLVGRMASNEDQVRWLVQETIDRCNEWPGPLVLRQIFCSRFKPADGKEAGSTKMFPDGVPSRKPQIGFKPNVALPTVKTPAQIEAAAIPLPPGHKVSADPELEAMIADAIEKMPKMPAARLLTGRDAQFAKLLEEISTAPQERPLPPAPTNPNYQPITQADIDKAVAELREKKARGAV